MNRRSLKDIILGSIPPSAAGTVRRREKSWVEFEREMRIIRRRRSRVEAEAEYSTTVEDVIVEILLRLPVKSLMRFKSVCTQWYDLILSPNFIAMYNQHKNAYKKVSLLSYTLRTSRVLSRNLCFEFDGVPMDLTIPPLVVVDSLVVGCFHGVVCLSLSVDKNKFALWNPATGNFREIDSMIGGHLRDTRRGWCGFGVSLDAVGIKFKVAHITFLNNFKYTDEETCAQVYIFSSSSNSWTQKKIDLPRRIREGPGVFLASYAYRVNWYIFWHVEFRERNQQHLLMPTDIYLLCFDMNDESFKRIEMPFSPMNGFDHLAGYKESVAMFVCRNTTTGVGVSYSDIDVWVMNDCSGTHQSWSKLLTCRPSIKVEKALGFFSKDDVDSVILHASDGFVYLYNPKTAETNKLWEAERVLDIFQYNESLASLK